MFLDSVSDDPEISRFARWNQPSKREKVLAYLEESYRTLKGRLTINGADVSSRDVSKEAVAGMLLIKEREHNALMESKEREHNALMESKEKLIRDWRLRCSRPYFCLTLRCADLTAADPRAR